MLPQQTKLPVPQYQHKIHIKLDVDRGSTHKCQRGVRAFLTVVIVVSGKGAIRVSNR